MCPFWTLAACTALATFLPVAKWVLLPVAKWLPIAASYPAGYAVVLQLDNTMQAFSHSLGHGTAA